MAKVLYEKDGRIGRITLNRPEVMNAIDDDLPRELAAAVAEADHDRDVHVMVLSGAGKAFCAGYDLAHYAAGNGPNKVVQDMPWDPMQDFQFMWANTQAFMSLFPGDEAGDLQGARVCRRGRLGHCALRRPDDHGRHRANRLHAHACLGLPDHSDVGARLGPEKAKRMMFTGDKISGVEAAEMGLVLKSVPDDQLDAEVEALAARMASVPINQLAMQKMVINAAVEEKDQPDAAPCHRVRRHHPPFTRRHELQSPRGASRLETSGAGTGRRNLRLDP